MTRTIPPRTRCRGGRLQHVAKVKALVVALALGGGWAAARAQAPAAAEPQMQVRGFQVQGNTLLPAAEVQAALAGFTGSRTLSDLQAAAQAVQALYARAGYAAVVVYLPPQPVADGQVSLSVVEGKVARIDVQGASRTRPEQLRAALPSLVTGATPRVRQIDRELQIANESPGRTMAVLLGPGAQPGEVVATIKVDEQPQNSFTVTLDNTGNERTGDYRVALGWQRADLTGRDDSLALQVQTSPTEASAVRVASAGYRLPLPGLRMAVDAFAAYSDVDGGTQQLANNFGLSFAGRGRIAGARLVWYLPRVGEFDQRLSGGLEWRTYLNDCDLSNQGTSTACGGSASADVTVHPFTLEYAAQQGGSTPVSVHLGLVHNLGLGGEHGDASDFDAARDGARRRYTVLRAGAQGSVAVFDEWRLAARVSGQHSSHALVAGEQFGLGGATSVRGYEERELSGDKGLFGSVELISPRLAATALPPQAELRLLAFAEAGQVSNNRGLACGTGGGTCDLSSWGLGLRLGWGPVSLRWDLAQALQDGATTGRRDWRHHLALTASF